jgi:hypothetical protein
MIFRVLLGWFAVSAVVTPFIGAMLATAGDRGPRPAAVRTQRAA